VKGENIASRLRALGAGVVTLCRALPTDAATAHVTRQLVRAATSSGANYAEARGAESRADFVHKLGVANKELRETLYWLELISDTTKSDVDVAALAGETDELIAILTASIRTARAA
jgi:four helix bundle protein